MKHRAQQGHGKKVLHCKADVADRRAYTLLAPNGVCPSLHAHTAESASPFGAFMTDFELDLGLNSSLGAIVQFELTAQVGTGVGLGCGRCARMQSDGKAE